MSVAAATVRVVEPETEPEVAVMVALPAETPVASPALLMLATLALFEVQLTEFVRFFVVLSL